MIWYWYDIKKSDTILISIQYCINIKMISKWYWSKTSSFSKELVSNSLINIFYHYKIGTQKIKPFLFLVLAEFYKYLDTNIWKVRNIHFKDFKQINKINKKSFKDYHKNFLTCNLLTSHITVSHINHTWWYYNLVQQINILNHASVLDPREEWIIWTSSNFLHNGPLKASIDISSFHSPDGAFL